MPSSLKSLWLVLVLVAAGAVALSFTIGQKQPAEQPVVMEEVFKQAPVDPAATVTAAGSQDPVPSPAILTTPENGQEAAFVVQVYSFHDNARADKALEALKAAGYKAFMEVSDLGEKGTWYRVRIGELENEERAKAVLEEVRKNYNSGFIVKPKK